MMMKIVMLSLLLAICVWSAIGCGGPSKEEVALETAQQWVDTSIGQVSESVVELVAGENPALTGIAGGVLAEQVRDNLDWEYSTPQRESGDLYSLTATASGEFEVKVPLLDTQEYSASVPFNLTVDTSNRTVEDWSVSLHGPVEEVCDGVLAGRFGEWVDPPGKGER